MRHVVTAEEMRALDAATIDGIGLPGAVLMENAGRAVVRVIEDILGEADPGLAGALGARVAVVCGAGNNGGDGYVIARCLRESGVDATVYLAAKEASIRGDAKLHLEVYRALNGPVVTIADNASLAAHSDAIASADVVVDAIFGTGLSRVVEGRYRELIEIVNRCPGHRVAVDIPSGLAADTGQVLGVAVHATCTVTMAFLKVGLATAPGFAHCGAVHVAEIGIPTALAAQHKVRTALLEAADVAPLIPVIDPLTHKNRRGHVLAVAGSPGKRGAARLLAWAALRTGAGLVTVAAPWAGGEVYVPDPVMTEALDPDVAGPDVAGPDVAGPDAASPNDPDVQDRNVHDPVAARLRFLVRGKQALAVGPGMPTTAGGRKLVHAALADIGVPVVLDADALNHLGQQVEPVAAAPMPVVMTPHPGEAARLLGCTSAEVQQDRVAAVRTLAQRCQATVVLKGARTLVCDPNGMVTINPSGNQALATAGSGDVLTGIIAALLAQGVEATAAAQLGVYIHGKAGERAAAALGRRGVTAADLAERVPAALDELEAGP